MDVESKSWIENMKKKKDENKNRNVTANKVKVVHSDVKADEGNKKVAQDKEKEKIADVSDDNVHEVKKKLEKDNTRKKTKTKKEKINTEEKKEKLNTRMLLKKKSDRKKI